MKPSDMPDVALRPLRLGDAAEMTQVLDSPELYAVTGGRPPSERELRQRYEVQVRGRSSDGTQRWINDIVVLQPSGQVIGYVQATIPLGIEADRPTEIAWVIGVPWQRRGFARAAVALLVESLCEDGVTTVIAHIHPQHVASHRVAESIGMTPTDVVVDGEVRWVARLGRDRGLDRAHGSSRAVRRRR